jgi:uncharacterized protein Yka (UPF0111/DUF47 family)
MNKLIIAKKHKKDIEATVKAISKIEKEKDKLYTRLRKKMKYVEGTNAEATLWDLVYNGGSPWMYEYEE